MKLFVKVFLLLGVALVQGCTQLPLNGPTYRDINSSASEHLAVDRRALAFDYILVDVSQPILESLTQVGAGSLYTTFNARKMGPPAVRIGVGDVLQVSVFESSVGGLFLPAETGQNQRPANFITIPNQTVSRTGNISIPYAGNVHVAGRIAPDVERDIEKKLASRAVEPQVVVSVIEQNSSAVSVLGDSLNGSNKFKLAGSGERILDIISRAGGSKFPGYELFVTLQRQNRRATIHFPRLVNDPSENIYVAPGDTIYVFHEQQKFVALGATGAVSSTSVAGAVDQEVQSRQYAFNQERLSLNQALAKAGGLQDSRANPAQVFLYRMEHRETLERMGMNLLAFAPDQKFIPTVYRLDFRDPSSFFAAQKFQMRNEDVIYASNSESVEVTKFLGYVRTVTSTVSGVATDARLTSDIISGSAVLP